MTIRTKQLLWIKEATHSNIYTWKTEAEVHGQKKTLVQSLKQFHAHFYQLYEKGMTQAMVGLQGVHKSDAFKCSNILAIVGLKSFGSWCLKPGGTLKQSLSILEMFITGWWLYAMYASLLPAWMHSMSWITIHQVWNWKR